MISMSNTMNVLNDNFSTKCKSSLTQQSLFSTTHSRQISISGKFVWLLGKVQLPTECHNLYCFERYGNNETLFNNDHAAAPV